MNFGMANDFRTVIFPMIERFRFSHLVRHASKLSNFESNDTLSDISWSWEKVMPKVETLSKSTLNFILTTKSGIAISRDKPTGNIWDFPALIFSPEIK